MSETPVFIEVTELRAVGADTYGWKCLKRTKKLSPDTGKASGGYSGWDSYSYHSSFGKCCAYLEEEQIRTCGASTLTELRRMAERIHAMWLEIVEKGKLV